MNTPKLRPEAAPLLSVTMLSKSFAGLVALADVSFSVQIGTIKAVIGPNGAGKSTLVNVLTGTFPPSAGVIVFQGQDTKGLKQHEVARRGMARTFQLMKPFGSMTVHENVVVAALQGHSSLNEAREFSMGVIASVGLTPWANFKASDLSTASGKRLELARALATEPKLLLLDEVLAGLSPAERAPLVELLRKIAAEGVSMLFVEHVMEAVMALSDEILVLHHGQVLADGRPDEVSENPSVVAAYLGKK